MSFNSLTHHWHSTVLWCHHIVMFLLILDLINKCWVVMVILHWLSVLGFSPTCHGYNVLVCPQYISPFILWIQLLANKKIPDCEHIHIQTEVFVMLLVIYHGLYGCFIYTVILNFKHNLKWSVLFILPNIDWLWWVTISSLLKYLDSKS